MFMCFVLRRFRNESRYDLGRIPGGESANEIQLLPVKTLGSRVLIGLCGARIKFATTTVVISFAGSDLWMNKLNAGANFISAQVVIHSSSRANTGAVSGSLIAEMLASRTGVEPCRRRERAVTYCNSMELRGMDSTLPHFKDSGERILDLYWTRETGTNSRL